MPLVGVVPNESQATLLWSEKNIANPQWPDKQNAASGTDSAYAQQELAS
jgi:hypothetical protein